MVDEARDVTSETVEVSNGKAIKVSQVGQIRTGSKRAAGCIRRSGIGARWSVDDSGKGKGSERGAAGTEGCIIEPWREGWQRPPLSVGSC